VLVRRVYADGVYAASPRPRAAPASSVEASDARLAEYARGWNRWERSIAESDSALLARARARRREVEGLGWWGVPLAAYPRRPRRRGGRRGHGLLSSIAGILDKPFEWASREGSRAVSYLMGRAVEAESRGEDARGLLYSIGASAAAFAAGALAGITGLVSPRAWRETVETVRHPRGLLESLKNPLSWSYLAGSIIGPAKLFDFAGARLARVREPDLAVTDRGSLTFNAIKTRSGEVKWTARIEAEGPTRPLGRASAAVEGAPERSVELETPRARVEVVEARRGRVVRRAFRVVYKDTGRRLVGLEEWRFEGWLRPRYRYKGLLVDPMRAEAVALEAPRPGGAPRGILGALHSMLPPPRVAVAPRLWPLGAGLGGLASLGGLEDLAATVESLRASPAPELAPGAASGSLAATGEEESTGLEGGQSLAAGSLLGGAGASTGLAAPAAPLLPRVSPRLRLPGARGLAAPLGRRRRRREVYSEIVYPHAWLPL
jgi:hypothetical protein